MRGDPVTEVGEELEEEEEEGEPEPRPPDVRLPQAEEPAAPTGVRTSVADRSWCAKAAREHGVVPHQTWGSLPAASQDTWTKLGCDRAVLTLTPTPRRPAASVRRPAAAAAGDGGDGGNGGDGGAGGDAGRICSQMRETHHVLPGTSWGTLSERQKRLWDQLDCNTIDPELMRQKVRYGKSTCLGGATAWVVPRLAWVLGDSAVVPLAPEGHGMRSRLVSTTTALLTTDLAAEAEGLQLLPTTR